MKITAAVVPVPSASFAIETLDLGAPLADEVLVRVVASGMCHTDLHAHDGYCPNLPYPVVCGHEGAGIIEQVGAAVADLAPGDPVVISFPWCGECGPSRAARIAYCERARPLKSSRLPTAHCVRAKALSATQHREAITVLPNFFDLGLSTYPWRPHRS